MKKTRQCSVHFTMDGKDYGFIMPAESWDDAYRRLTALKLTGNVAGFPCYSVKLPSPLMYLAMPFLALFTGLLNLFAVKPGDR